MGHYSLSDSIYLVLSAAFLVLLYFTVIYCFLVLFSLLYYYGLLRTVMNFIRLFAGVDFRNQALWLKYAEMEMKNKFVNHARNVWDRTVTIHPRVDVFW